MDFHVEMRVREYVAQEMGEEEARRLAEMRMGNRTEGDPMGLAPAVERIVREIDPTLPVADLKTFEDNVAGAMAQPRFAS